MMIVRMFVSTDQLVFSVCDFVCYSKIKSYLLVCGNPKAELHVGPSEYSEIVLVKIRQYLFLFCLANVSVIRKDTVTCSSCIK